MLFRSWSGMQQYQQSINHERWLSLMLGLFRVQICQNIRSDNDPRSFGWGLSVSDVVGVKTIGNYWKLQFFHEVIKMTAYPSKVTALSTQTQLRLRRFFMKNLPCSWLTVTQHWWLIRKISLLWFPTPTQQKGKTFDFLRGLEAVAVIIKLSVICFLHVVFMSNHRQLFMPISAWFNFLLGSICCMTSLQNLFRINLSSDKLQACRFTTLSVADC